MKKTIIVHIDSGGRPGLHGVFCPLKQASLPNLDHLASHGEWGRLGVPGETRPFAGELAFLALLGCDPLKWYPGPGPFEGANLEVHLEKHDVAFLCDLVTLRGQEGWGDGKKLGPQLIMDDSCGGGVDAEEAREFLDAINDQLILENIQIYLGYGHRHLLVWAGGGGKVLCHDPQKALGEPIEGFLPTGDGSKILRELMEASRVILRNHELNQERMDEGRKPSNCLWLWGPGRFMEWPNLPDLWSIHGSVISSEGPYRGVGIALGLHPVTVDREEAEEEVWLQSLAETAAQHLQKEDVVGLHVPIDRSGQKGDMENANDLMVQSLEKIDTHILGPLQKMGSSIPQGIRLMVCCPTQVLQTGQESENWSPYILYDESMKKDEGGSVHFNEEEAAKTPLRDATKFFERLVMKP